MSNFDTKLTSKVILNDEDIEMESDDNEPVVVFNTKAVEHF